MAKVKIVKKYVWVNPAANEHNYSCLNGYNDTLQEYDFTLNQRFDSEDEAIAAYQKFAENCGAYSVEDIRLEPRYTSVFE